MAFSKKHKREMIAQYTQWLKNSQAMFMLGYTRMSMKEIDALRAKVREAGGEAHVIKNTLLQIALHESGIQGDTELTGTTLVGFAFQDVPALAKVFNEASKAESFKLKGGFLDFRLISSDDIKALADMPPLPVMRARILGMLQAPASRLVRTFAEPARQMAAVVKAYSEKSAVPAA